METVFFVASFEGIDMIGGLCSLSRMIGMFKINTNELASSPDELIVTFLTDKVQFEKDESRQVELIFHRSPDLSIELKEIKKVQQVQIEAPASIETISVETNILKRKANRKKQMK